MLDSSDSSTIPPSSVSILIPDAKLLPRYLRLEDPSDYKGNEGYDWLRRQFSAISSLVHGKGVLSKYSGYRSCDDMWVVRGSCYRLKHTIDELGRFYRSWMGKRLEPLSKLVMGFRPILTDIRRPESIYQTPYYFHIVEQLLLVHGAGIAVDDDMSNCATRTLVKLGEIDPTVRRMMRVVESKLKPLCSDAQEREAQLWRHRECISSLIDDLFISIWKESPFRLRVRPQQMRDEWEMLVGSLLSGPPIAPYSWSDAAEEVPFWTLSQLGVSCGSSSLLSTTLEVAKLEGYKVNPALAGDRWPRDICVQIGSQVTMYPRQSSYSWYPLYKRLVGWDGKSSVSMQSHPDFDNSYFHDYSQISSNDLSIIEHKSRRTREAHSYFEGGNVIAACLNGKRIYLMGAHNAVATWLQLRPIFSDPERYNAGWMKHLRERRAAKVAKLLKRGQGRNLFRYDDYTQLIDQGYIPRGRRKQPAACREVYAELQIAREMLQNDFQEETIILLDGGSMDLPQIGFHIDMSVAALPGGHIILQDHRVCAKVLQAHLKSGTLTDDEESLFENYLESAVRTAKVEAPLVDGMAAQLKERGFKVHLVPAVYRNGNELHINYVNGVYHLGKDQHSVAEIMGYDTGGERRLRDAYIRFLKHHCGVQRVYCHGRHTSVGAVRADGSIPYEDSQERLADHGAFHCSTNHRWEVDDKLLGVIPRYVAQPSKSTVDTDR